MSATERLLVALLVVLVLLAYGIAGTSDYQTRCAELSPASIEEVQAR